VFFGNIRLIVARLVEQYHALTDFSVAA
jgi:hypothetical protein